MRDGSAPQALLLSYASGVMLVVSVQDMILPALTDATTTALGVAYLLCVVIGMMCMFVLGSLVPSDVAVSLPFFAPDAAPEGGEAGGAAAGAAAGAGEDDSEEGLLAADEGGEVRSRGGRLGSPTAATDGRAGRGGAAAERLPAEGTGGDSKPAAGGRAAGQARLAVVMCAALTLHNLPEGIAVAASSMSSASAGERLTVAIAIHNAVEGAALAAPIVAATGSLGKAFAATLLSGLTEPLGAAITLLLMGQASAGSSAGPNTAGDFHVALACTVCAAAGVMVQVCAQELLPEAWASAVAARQPLPCLRGSSTAGAAAVVVLGTVLGGVTMPVLAALGGA